MSEKDDLREEQGCGRRGNGEHSCGCDGKSSGNGEHSCGCGGDGEHSCRCKNQGNDASDAAEDVFSQDFALPKPTLITLATTIAQQAMVSMGVLPNPMTGKTLFLMNQATHLIDTVELIFEKTAGNRTDDETKILENVLHELRMLFVAASNEKSRRDAAQAAGK